MNNTKNRLIDHAKPPLVKLFTMLTLLLITVSILIALLDIKAGYSFLIGGLIFILPNMYFAAKVFRYSGAQMATQVTQSFYRAESGKFVISLVFFAVVFSVVKPLNITALFLAYLLLALINSVLVFSFNKH